MPDPPADVTDVMLWRLATEIADHHQPDRAGRCAHLICHGAAWPCPPHQLAARGDRAARRTATTFTTPPSPADVARLPRRPVALLRRTPSWVALPVGTGQRPQPGSDAATILALLQPGPATADTLAQRTDLSLARIAHTLAALRRHQLAAPLTDALDRPP